MDNNFNNEMMQNPASAPVPPTSPNYSVPQNNNVSGQASGYMGQQANGYYAGTETYVYQQNVPYAAPVRKKHKALTFIIVGVSLVALVGVFFILKFTGVISFDSSGSLFGLFGNSEEQDDTLLGIPASDDFSDLSGNDLSGLFNWAFSDDAAQPDSLDDVDITTSDNYDPAGDVYSTTPAEDEPTDIQDNYYDDQVADVIINSIMIDPTDDMITIANFAAAGVAHNSVKRNHYYYDSYSDEIGWGVHNALYYLADENNGAYLDQNFNCFLPTDQAHDIISSIYGFDMSNLSDIMYTSDNGDFLKVDCSTYNSYKYSLCGPYRGIRKGNDVYVSGSVFDSNGSYIGDMTVKMTDNDDSELGFTLKEAEFTKSESVGMSATATSTLKPQAGNNYDAGNIIDGSMDTAWVEGKSGLGIGEKVTITLDKEMAIAGFAIYAGYMKDLNSFTNNGRPTKVSVSFDDGYTYDVELEPEYDDRYHNGVWFTLDTINYSDKFTIEILEAEGGSKYDDVCITEFKLFTVSEVSEIVWDESCEAIYELALSSGDPSVYDESAGFNPDSVLYKGTPMTGFKHAGTYQCMLSDVIDDLAPKIILDTDGYCALYTYEDNQSYQMKYDGWYTYDIVEPEFESWGDTSYIHMHFPTEDGEMTADAVIELGMLIFETEGYGRMINGEGNGSLGGIFEYCY